MSAPQYSSRRESSRGATECCVVEVQKFELHEERGEKARQRWNTSQWNRQFVRERDDERLRKQMESRLRKAKTEYREARQK